MVQPVLSTTADEVLTYRKLLMVKHSKALPGAADNPPKPEEAWDRLSNLIPLEQTVSLGEG